MKLNRTILITFLFISIGTIMELYLLEHYEDRLQLIPILCIALLLVLMVILLFRKSAIVQGVFKFVLLLTAGSGVYGIFLHLSANYEFEQEMRPSVKGWDLFVESLSGALPTLAPGSMIVLALIGYSYLTLLKQQQ
ncbi:MAG: hypothetical protein AAFQ20_03045 [Bacteroidota bacterium]